MAVLAAATLALLVGGVAVLSPTVRAALLRSFLVPGSASWDSRSRRRRFGPLATGSSSEPVPLSEARAEVDFPIRLPSELGSPDRVFLEEAVPGGRVWLRIEPALGSPDRRDGVGVLITQFRAGIEEEFLKKVEAEGGSFMPIQVDDNQGYWIRGAHALFFVDGSGDGDRGPHPRGRQRPDVERGGVTYRIESDLGLSDTLRIAHSIR